MGKSRTVTCKHAERKKGKKVLKHQREDAFVKRDSLSILTCWF
jgi:hypothetical protein